MVVSAMSRADATRLNCQARRTLNLAEMSLSVT